MTSIEAIQALIAYNWSAEERDWDEHGQPAEGHIFLALQKLDEEFGEEL